MSVPADQMSTSLAGAVDAGVALADDKKIPEAESNAVKKLNGEYTDARTFDEYARRNYAIDRRYAQGNADPNWHSDANIIGAFIDILVSFLYAKDPDTSVRPAPRAGGQPDKNAQLFAETLQIVISRLWKKAHLKARMKKVLRSALSVGPGWIKALAYSETKTNPLVKKQLDDARDNIERIEAAQKLIGEGVEGATQDEKITELQQLMLGLKANLELLIKQGICIDFCRAEDMQVSLDVADTADYLEADWVSNDLYIQKKDLMARFPVLTQEDVSAATVYSQRRPTPADQDVAPSTMSVSSEGSFVKGDDAGAAQGGKNPIQFAKVVELWDHRDNLVKTFIDGVQKWAREPYPPPQASTRFYPYFRVAFFETDGSRHPQSLSGRMKKLQDEYSQARSAGRLTRERSIPGTVFNAGQLDPADVKKLQDSQHMEMVGINPTDHSLSLDKIITAKPVPRIDPLMFDTQPVQRDMEVISGVQEAKQGQISSAKTATEAEIQESGFASRTSADRDAEEDMLNELAQYTAELAIQTIKPDMAQKIAGPLAYWPFGMDVQDILMMMDVEIMAGTTGKPRARADKETWATLLPLVQQMQSQIVVMDMSNPPLAKAMRALMRETLRRLDDTINIDELLPPPPAIGTPLVSPLPAGPGAAPGEVAPEGASASSAPPVGNGTVNNPGAQAPP